MIVYLVAVAQSMLYLAAVPVCAAFCVSSRQGLRAGTGAGAFAGRGALARARRAMAKKARRRGKPGLRYRRILSLLKRLKILKITLRGAVSLGDAAATALACGAMEALAASLRGRAEALEIRVTPDFSGDMRLELQGMIRARAGQIILAAARSGIDEIRGRIVHGKAPD